MKRKKRSLLARLSSGESGQALIIVLIFLVLGSLTLVPTLTHIGTALKTGEIYEENTNEIYAADSGIEDALWQIKYDGLESIFESPYYNYIFSANASYLLDDPVNGFSTNVTITNIWTPTNVPYDFLTPAQYKNVIERDITDNTTNRLVISGTPIDSENYRIKIDYYPAEDVADNLTVSSIGIWFPSGFAYDGDCNLATFPDSQDKYIETSEPSPGGQATVWDFSAIDPLRLTDLPPEGLTASDNPQTTEITFRYTGGTASIRPNGIAWIVTADELADYYYPYGGGVPISWDIDTRLYKIVAVAGDTEVEAYTSRSEMRNMYVSTPGDYVAIGNSLMTDDNNDGYIRETLLSESMTPLTGLPDDAYISHAYLYWSGFFRSGFSQEFWPGVDPDGCSNFNNWDRAMQTRVPTNDGYTSGTWNTAPYWDDVDETTPDDLDWMTGVTTASGSSYRLFTFSPFSVPAGATIANLTVYFRAKDDGTNVNNLQAGLKADDLYYNGSDNDPGPTWTTYTYPFNNNPNTGNPWTAADINGTSTDPLQQFGVYSTDLDPDIQVSMVYAVVTYSCWTISSNRFLGDGGGTASDAARTLTLKTAQDLTSRPPGSTIVEWEQRNNDTLEESDALKFQISGNNGINWSNPITAFADDIGSSMQYYYYIIPEDYLTSQFKIKFYLDGFNENSEYCYIDNIALATITGTPDADCLFTIDGYNVLTDEPVNALVSQLIGNKEKGQYSYSCWQDVTDLVRAHSERNDNDEPIGNADYTVGGVNADDGYYDHSHTYELAYAGWSLVVIYHSESTAGRQLYLWNYFSYSKGNENLDFDRDGSPGGTIKGFLVPHRIGSESEAAKLTCFVGEGDGIYDGDQLIFNGTALDDGYDINNVWNSQSVGMSKSGVDIDTFHILWDDEILLAGDMQAQIDLETDTDNFNLIYLILSVRSKTTVGGTTHYVIRGG